MVNPKINYVMEVLMIICGILLGVTTFFVGDGGEGNGVLGEGITQLHHILGYVLLVMILLHVILHFRFIIAMTKNLSKKKDKKQS